jgi:putative membrane protein
MFICNFKVNKKAFFKGLIILFTIIALILLAISISKIFKEIKNSKSNEVTTVNDTIPSPDVAVLTEENYTNILKEVHENLNTYVGQKISFTGYVYRVADIKENEFILARDMIINSKNQTVVVGFLCKYENATEFANNTWVNITGTIEKGDYYGEIPIINISSIQECAIPDTPLVSPPSDTYIPTAIIY